LLFVTHRIRSDREQISGGKLTNRYRAFVAFCDTVRWYRFVTILLNDANHLFEQKRVFKSVKVFRKRDGVVFSLHHV
jgi:hypothetical protein